MTPQSRAKVAYYDQEEIAEEIHMLLDLLNFQTHTPICVGFYSEKLLRESLRYVISPRWLRKNNSLISAN